MLILSTAYFAPIAHYHLIRKSKKRVIDGQEHFLKRSHRSRCEILGANGPLKLSIPLKKYSHKAKTEDIRISYDEDWQSNHWKSIQSAYRNSAYFEFYEDDFKEFFNYQLTDRLVDFNALLEDRVLQLLQIEAEKVSASDHLEKESDWRKLLDQPKDKMLENSFFPFYQQVFMKSKAFHPNLSIIDLLFNLGPASRRYLAEVKLQN